MIALLQTHLTYPSDDAVDAAGQTSLKQFELDQAAFFSAVLGNGDKESWGPGNLGCVESHHTKISPFSRANGLLRFSVVCIAHKQTRQPYWPPGCLLIPQKLYETSLKDPKR